VLSSAVAGTWRKQRPRCRSVPNGGDRGCNRRLSGAALMLLDDDAVPRCVVVSAEASQTLDRRPTHSWTTVRASEASSTVGSSLAPIWRPMCAGPNSPPRPRAACGPFWRSRSGRPVLRWGRSTHMWTGRAIGMTSISARSWDMRRHRSASYPPRAGASPIAVAASSRTPSSVVS
jgi:hypothetical protein